MTARGEEPEDRVDARFSLANERTFLAWNRTALALVAGGLAVSQLLPDGNAPGARRLLGLPLIILGAVIAWFSYSRWQAVEQAIENDEPLPPTWLPRILAAAVLVGAIVGLVLAAIGPEA
jgi:putative membrane protein